MKARAERRAAPKPACIPTENQTRHRSGEEPT